MANNPSTLPDYNGQTNPPDAAYPYGSARDDAAPGDLTGTPRVAAELKDLQGFQQALLTQAGIVPSGTPDTATVSQYLDALRSIISSRAAATFATIADMEAGTPVDGGAIVFKVGQELRTVSAFGTGHGGWVYDVTNDAPNGLNKRDLGGGLTATARLTGGVVPAGAYGATLDNVTDDFNALTELHNDSVTYSLDGRTALCSGTLEPKTGQKIYPFGGGIRKNTAGYLFSRNGTCDRFIIEKGGLFDGDDVADFCEMDGAFGFGNAWTNCEINAVGTGFVKAFRMSNARRCTIKGRYGCREAVDYVNKSAECDIQFANFVRAGALAGTRGLLCADEGDGYPEGLVVAGGMFFDFAKNMDLDEFFELNFMGIEFAGSSGTYGTDGHQIDVKHRTGGFARGLYFDAHCHFSGRGVRFGDGTDVSPHNFDATLDGNFRSQVGGETVRIDAFQRDIHVKDGTIFRSDGSPGTRIAVVGVNQQQGITVGTIKCYGYNSYTQLNGSGALNQVANIPNTSELTTPVAFQYAVDYKNVQGMGHVRGDQQITQQAYAAATTIASLTLDLGEGVYFLRGHMTISAVSTAGTISLNMAATGSGTFDVASGGGWSSVFQPIVVGQDRWDKETIVSVTKGGEFTITLATTSAAITTNGFHDYLSVEAAA